MPQAWKDALSAAVQAGKIPNIPPTSDPNNGNPVYPSGYNPSSPQVCSATYKCRITGDIWDAPQGVIGISFDDGPLPVSLLFTLQITPQGLLSAARGPNAPLCR
jgi:chitin deacetylase